MKKFYLFSFIKESQVFKKGPRLEKFLIVFYPYKNLSDNPTDIYNQLRTYFQFNILPDRIIVICSQYNELEIVDLFKRDSEIYKYIPLFTLDSDRQNVSINSLQKNGDVKYIDGFNIDEEFISEIFNRGLTKIFSDKGGLIVSQSAHHFVFPSGKHSDRFLRPGNVLIKGLHINFLAYALYRHTKGKKYQSIYCDTSSINSLAFAYVNLVKEFDRKFTTSVQVESFGSYQGFETGKFSAPKDSLFLISSSTSGSIVSRMINDRKQIIKTENICVLYGLDVDEHSETVVCNLSFDEGTNPQGLYSFESYNVSKGVNCKFCSDNSIPVEVKGDVFLLEKPSINGKLLTILDNPSTLKNFSPYFIKGNKGQSLIKCYYKENSSQNKKYELFIDIDMLLMEWEKKTSSHAHSKIFSRLEKHILQNIPASLKYIVVLPDQSSLALANVITSVLNDHGIAFQSENILQIHQINTIDPTKKGSIAVVSACVITGRNLLYISRALREFEDNYRRIYFTFLNRTANKKHFEFLESNLSLGEFGKGTHKIVNVDSILCSHESYHTPWHIEKEFLKKLEEFCEENEISKVTISFCARRISELNNSGKTKGLTNNLFFKSPSGKILKINKGFAFAPTSMSFIESAKQSDIYFIISTILNDLRCTGKLEQSEYVRNLLEPGNFVRFNDGIIQASILRAAKNEELRYDLSPEMSLQIQGILEDMINHFHDAHAEALHEFLYVLAIKKMRITKTSLDYSIALIESKNLIVKDSLLKGILLYIKAKC